MAKQDSINLVTAGLRAFNESDWAALDRLWAPDVTYIIRGEAPFSGTYHGREAMAAVLREIGELTDGTATATPEVMVAGEDVVMAYLHVTASRPDGRVYDNYQAYLYRLRDGQLIEGQTIPVDQRAFTEFFS